MGGEQSIEAMREKDPEFDAKYFEFSLMNQREDGAKLLVEYVAKQARHDSWIEYSREEIGKGETCEIEVFPENQEERGDRRIFITPIYRDGRKGDKIDIIERISHYQGTTNSQGQYSEVSANVGAKYMGAGAKYGSNSRYDKTGVHCFSDIMRGGHYIIEDKLIFQGVSGQNGIRYHDSGICWALTGVETRMSDKAPVKSSSNQRVRLGY